MVRLDAARMRPVASAQLFDYLAGLQKAMFEGHAGATAPGPALLGKIKQQTPPGALSAVDGNTIDLLSTVFDVIFSDRHIAPEIKSLIGFLQVPVLKAALLDQDFFFDDTHPARRMIDVLAKSSAGWDPQDGARDPLFQALKRNVDRVQREFDQQMSVFSDVVSELEAFIRDDEAAAIGGLAAPIDSALRQEKLGQARRAAQTEVALRIGTGEVVAFVETFLENRWVPVLTIAYARAEAQPQAVSSALQTMDDLIWSVKPKITPEQRKELIAKLPSMLARLNKWLNLIEWEDSDRLQFFAELAECHASIVRAPVNLSPERQLELALEVAQKAAERRLEKQANAKPEPPPDEFVERLAQLQSGMWLEFAQPDGSRKKVKLAWVSPMRSLYIFTTRDRQESFSISDEDLAQALREQRASVVPLAGLVDRALTQALEGHGGQRSAACGGRGRLDHPRRALVASGAADPAADPLDAGQVAPALHLLESRRRQQRAHRRRLVVAVFEQQPAVRCQMAGGAVDDAAQRASGRRRGRSARPAARNAGRPAPGGRRRRRCTAGWRRSGRSVRPAARRTSRCAESGHPPDGVRHCAAPPPARRR